MKLIKVKIVEEYLRAYYPNNYAVIAYEPSYACTFGPAPDYARSMGCYSSKGMILDENT
jgi:hypothetical protein